MNQIKNPIKYASKEDFLKILRDVVISPERLGQFTLEIIPSLYETIDGARPFSYKYPIGYINFVLETNGTLMRFQCNEVFSANLSEENRHVLDSVEKYLHQYLIIRDYSEAGIITGISNALKEILENPFIKKMILDAEVDLETEDTIIYKVVRFIGREEEEILQTKDLSFAISKLTEFSSALPNEHMLIRGKSSKETVLSISAYEKASFVKTMLGKLPMWISPCVCGEKETLKQFVENRFVCSHCKTRDISRVVPIEKQKRIAETIESYLKEKIELGALSKKNSSSRVIFNLLSAQYLVLELKVLRLFMRITFPPYFIYGGRLLKICRVRMALLLLPYCMDLGQQKLLFLILYSWIILNFPPWSSCTTHFWDYYL